MVPTLHEDSGAFKIQINSGQLDEAEPTSDVEGRDGITIADAIEDGTANEPRRVENGEITSDDDAGNEEHPRAGIGLQLDGSSQALARDPRASRIYAPRVTPPPHKPAAHWDPGMALEFDQDNPKRADTLTHNLYEKFKGAKTVAEALELGATKGHIRYELRQGAARLVASADAPAAAAAPAVAARMVILTAAGMDVPGRLPLIEGCCSEDNPLGETGDSLKPAPNFVRFTLNEDLGCKQTVRDALGEVGRPRAARLHGSLPCMPWSPWQRLNLKKGCPSLACGRKWRVSELKVWSS